MSIVLLVTVAYLGHNIVNFDDVNLLLCDNSLTLMTLASLKIPVLLL